MAPIKEFDQRHADAKRSQAEALDNWKTANPDHANSKSHQAAFLSGLYAGCVLAGVERLEGGIA